MGELGDYWREHRDYKRGIKDRQREKMPSLVERIKGTGFKITEHNEGEHIKIYVEAETVDYWPSTGRWTHNKKTGFGIKKLLNYLRKLKEVNAYDIPY